MSPEQATGDREVDNRTDIYAVGAVLYEMLTGEPPFTGRTPQAVIARTLTERPRPLGATREGLPPGLEAVVMQALARSPADRFPSSEALASALQMLSARPAITAETSPVRPLAADSGRWIGLGALAMVALTAVSFFAGRAGLPRWVLWMAVVLLAIGAVVLALTSRVERARRFGQASGGIAGMLSWRNAGLGGLVAVILWATTAAVVSARRPAALAGSGSVSGTRVAVLPFQNQGDTTDNYVVDGITDEIRGKLSRISGLAVIASGSSNEYRGTRLPPQQVAEQLGADYLLVGRVRWAPGAGSERRVQVVSELVNRSTGQTSWQQSFEASLTDVFQMQGEVASRVAAALGAQLGASDTRELAKAATAVPAAWDAYLHGKAITGNDPVALRGKVSHYEQAVALDSTLVDAWAALSLASSTLYFNGNRDPVASRRAREAWMRALALDSANASAQLAAANYYALIEPNQARMESFIESALRLAPRDVDVLVAAGNARTNSGRIEEAIALYQQARELDPRNRRVYTALHGGMLQAGRIAESVEAAEGAIALGQTGAALYAGLARARLAQGDTAAASAAAARATAHGESEAAIAAYFAGYNELSWVLPPQIGDVVFRLREAAFDGDRAWWGQSLATAHWVAGRPQLARVYADSALEASRRQVEDSPNDPSPLALYALVLAYRGDQAEAEAAAQRAMAMHGDASTFGSRYDRLQYIRVLLAGDKRDAAITELSVLLKEGGEYTPAWARVHPLFRSLRGDARFQALVRGS
jgi:TolB-like protein/tetratricopeptide (TPR) repeat protein